MDNEKAPAMDWNSLQVPLAGEKGAFIVNDIDLYLISQNLNEHNERRVSLGFERTE